MDIPSVNIAPFLDGTNKQSVSDRVAASCRDIGFLVIKGHGLKNSISCLSSFLWLIIFNSGVTFWLIYGFLKNDIAIILANSMTLILASSLLFMKIKEYYS